MAATQTIHPWQAVVRTVFQVAVSLAVVIPVVVGALGLPLVGGVAIAVAVAGGVTKVMALPEVEDFLTAYLPWLAADPSTFSLGTQTVYPWRAVLRTVFQAVVSLAAILPLVVGAAGLPLVGGVAIALAVAGGITKVMALPEVEQFLQTFLPWLAAEPK